MIVWGSRDREKKLGAAPFFCPSCGRDGTATHFKQARYFTLYFIPLFPIHTYGEFVRCDACSATFDPGILTASRAELMAATEPWICERCQNRNPASSGECLGCGTHRNAPVISDDFDL